MNMGYESNAELIHTKSMLFVARTWEIVGRTKD